MQLTSIACRAGHPRCIDRVRLSLRHTSPLNVKKPPQPDPLPKLVSLVRYAKECGVTYAAIVQRTKAKNNPLAIVEIAIPETGEKKRYIDTEANPPIKLDQARKPVK